MGPSHSSTSPDRVATYAVVVGALLGVAHVCGALVEPNVVAGVVSRLGVGLALFAGGAGVGWIGRRAGNVMSRMNDLSAQMAVDASDRATEMREVLERLGGIALAAKQQPQVTAAGGGSGETRVRPAFPLPLPTPDPDETSDAGFDPLPAADPIIRPATPVIAAASALPAPSRVPAVDPQLLTRILEQLAELREIALMNDEQRQLRLKQHLEAQRRTVLDKAFVCFRTGEWAMADEMLTRLEVQYPGETPVKQARGEFFRLRALAEPDALFKIAQQVRDLVHVNQWNRAIAMATAFVNNFPANEDGRLLLAEVHREHDAANDAEFQRRYEQVQANVNRRLWRAALADAEQLLNEFPDHPRAARLRQQQLRAMRDNADIEERQEHEMRIQLLLEARRFDEAVQAAEEIVRRFPDSPQAEALIERLPQLRELAAQDSAADDTEDEPFVQLS